MSNVRWVIGNARKLDLASIINGEEPNSYPLISTESIPRESFKIQFSGVEQSHTRANLKIQDGCDFYCFFCVIPYARGRARSRELDDLSREAKDLVAAGYQEIVLTGVNIGTYNHKEHKFIDIINTLEKINRLKRLRISSIEPTTIPIELLEKMQPGSMVCRHFHIPLQSGSDKILFKMNRHYSISEYINFINQAENKVKDLCLGTDIIVGYPGETDALFDETVDILNSLNFAYIHVFSYSEREQAKSKKFPQQVSEGTIRSRSRILRELSDQKRKNFMEPHIGTTQTILVEQKKEGFWTGLTDNFIRIKVASDLDLHNQFIPLRINKIVGREMIGSLI